MTNKVEIEKALGFPLTPIPTSMCHADGSICKTDKAQLIEVFEKNTVSIGPNQIRHHNFAGKLKNTQFKEALVKFVIDHWANDSMHSFIGNKTIYLSFDKCYSYRVVNNQVIRSIKESLSWEEHEEAYTRIINHICQISVDAQVVVRCSDSDILIILLGNLDHLNASLKLWNQWGVGNHERLISINDLYQDLGISLSKALPCFHAMTGCDYTPEFFRKGKLKPFKLLEKSAEYQLVCQEIITDDDDELEGTFATLEKFICHMYGVPNSSNVNDVRFYPFSKTYESKKLDDNFEKKCRSFDSLSLPPCKAELYQHLLRVRYVTKYWRKAHLKNTSSLSPLASGWIINEDKYDFVCFAEEQFPSSVADIVIKKLTLLENQNTTQDDDYDDINNNGSSDDDDDYEDVSVFCDTFTE
ncbi:uncharacterized protein TNCV_596271 [Trichonephila clavipes]|nr:uncharacterized protein TNCV_596271 [Trichonephila clavipes]